jgi:hypothetical protein
MHNIFVRRLFLHPRRGSLTFLSNLPEKGDDMACRILYQLFPVVFLLTTAFSQFSAAGGKKELPPPSFPQVNFPPPPLGGTPPGLVPLPPRNTFSFNIDPKAPITSLLPTPPKAVSKVRPLLNDDLANVPEVMMSEPMDKKRPTPEAMQEIAHTIAKINHLNQAKTDGFMKAMIAQHTDMRGMPFLMDKECRTCEEQAKMFRHIADHLNRSIFNSKRPEQGDFAEILDASVRQLKPSVVKSSTDLDYFYRATIAASMQILMPEPERFRTGLAKYLSTVPHLDATKALAKLALFSTEDTVRTAAIEGLKLRREMDYTDILMQGFNYPMPAVSKRTAEALIKLNRKDLLAKLVDVLEQPDPQMPVKSQVDGKEVSTVRELVRVNHHRNCLLCHAPGNTPNVPEGVLTVAVPLPTEPLPKPSDGGGYNSTPPLSPDILVRLDMTYLRQDFSLMMPVSESHPWPEMQRFDFMVRTRVLTTTEATELTKLLDKREAGQLPPNHRAALYALRELTGCDTEPAAPAWRRLLKQPGAERPLQDE